MWEQKFCHIFLKKSQWNKRHYLRQDIADISDCNIRARETDVTCFIAYLTTVFGLMLT
jgi:hypothetical protein